jgi:hypothetical protein
MLPCLEPGPFRQEDPSVHSSDRARRHPLPLLIVLFISGLTLGPAGAAEEPRRSPLAGVAALAKPVTVTETKIAVGELIQKLAVETGVKLTATREVADEPVAVVVKELPARELLEQVADLLDYTWVRASRARSASVEAAKSEHSGPAFEITQDVAAKQREEALRQALFRDMEQQFRQQVAHYVEMAALSQPQIDALLDAELRQSKRFEKLTPAQRRDLQSASEERQQDQRRALASSLSPPINRTMARLIGRLSRAQWDRLLRQGEALICSTEPQPGELPMPRDIAAALVTSPQRERRPDQATFPDDPHAEEAFRARERDMQAQWAAASDYQVRFRVDVHPSISSFFLISEARFRGEQSPRFQGSGGGLFVSGTPRDQVTREQAEEDTAQRRAAGEKDPILGVEKCFKPTAKPRVRGRDAEGSAGWSLWDLLPDLARTYGVNFISDAYWTRSGAAAPLDASAVAGQLTSLFRLLDRSVWFTHRWDRRGSLVRLRSRTWFDDRPREVPLRRVRQWQRLIDQHGALPLEEVLGSAASLTDHQLAELHLIEYELGLSEELSLIDAARHALRLYASLSPAQRQVLGTGKALAVAQLTPGQRDLFTQASGAQVRVSGVAMTAEEWAAGTLQVSRSPFVRVKERRRDSITTVDESAPSPAAPPALASAPPVPGGVAEKGIVTRYPLARLSFRLRYGQQLSEDFPLVIASPRGSVHSLAGRAAEEAKP